VRSTVARFWFWACMLFRDDGRRRTLLSQLLFRCGGKDLATVGGLANGSAANDGVVVPLSFCLCATTVSPSTSFGVKPLRQQHLVLVLSALYACLRQHLFVQLVRAVNNFFIQSVHDLLCKVTALSSMPRHVADIRGGTAWYCVER